MIAEAIVAGATAAGVAPSLMLAVCFYESSHRNVVRAVDGKSASLGVCQVKLATARMFNKKLYPSDLLKPEKNAYYASLYMAWQLKRYGGDTDKALAAYNAGSFDNRKQNVHNRYIANVKRYMEEQPWNNAQEGRRNAGRKSIQARSPKAGKRRH